MTLSALLGTARKSLRAAGVANPDVEAETIISHVLGLKRSEIYLDPGRVLTGPEEGRILEIVGRRAGRFPLQYLLGRIEFMGLPFEIKQGVFIPRPETEILVETVIGRGRRLPSPLAVLDIATGSGAIAISLAKYLKPEWMLATDISPEAIELARENARANDVETRIAFVVGDRLGFLKRRFDIVVCNPPYIAADEIDELQPEVRDFEPRLALDGGPDGLRFIAGVLTEIPSILDVGSIVAFEIGSHQAASVVALFEEAGLGKIEILKDLAGRDRIVIGVR